MDGEAEDFNLQWEEEVEEKVNQKGFDQSINLFINKYFFKKTLHK